MFKVAYFPWLFTNKKCQISAQSHVRKRLRRDKTKQFPTGIDHARPDKSQLLAYQRLCFMQIAAKVPYQVLFMIIILFVSA